MYAAPYPEETIYVVDDDFAIRDSLKALLEAYGYSPRVFGSGAEFLDGCAREDKGCVLLDVCLPEQDGFGVLAALRDKGNNLPVVLITAHDERVDKASMEKLDAFAILRKPLNAEELLDVVTRALSGETDSGASDGGQAMLCSDRGNRTERDDRASVS